MTNQRDDAVKKGEHCAWQIHYHFVFPVKCRRALLDEAMTTIVQETAAKIAERNESFGVKFRSTVAVTRRVAA